jgi:eukaryotic-like serine/threonine-protein kinase
LIGRKLSHYEIVADLGAGGMGVVYRAHDLTLNRDVAIKVLPHERALSDRARARFKREALAASALNHPNIVTIYEVNSEGGVDFLVMEYVRGSTLLSLLRKGTLSMQEAMRYLMQIADALTKAHAAGIIHRDLKPGNIMVTEDGLVKVLDFGLAKIAHDVEDSSHTAPTQSFSLTQPGMVTGTVCYMSPEQARGEKVDARSDIFSFGIVMFETLSGQLPFTGPNSMAVLHNLHFTPPRDITALRPDVPPLLVALIARMLEKDPEKRIQTMTEVLSILRFGRSTTRTSSVAQVGSATWMEDSAISELLTPTAARRATAGKRRRWAIVGAAIWLVVGIGVWRYEHFRKTRPNAASGSVPVNLSNDAYGLYQQAEPHLEMWDRPGNLDKAINLLQRGVQADPQSAVSYAALSQAYSRKNLESPDPQWAKLAADNASRAVAINGDLAAAHLALGEVKQQSGDSGTAEREYKRAVELDPKSAIAHAMLAHLYHDTGRTQLADKELQLALAANPNDWEIYLEIGAQAYAGGRYADAVTAWQHVLKLQPDELRALQNLSAAYHAEGRDDDAAAALQEALAIKPTADVYNNLGTIRYYQGKYDLAEAAFEKTVALNANTADNWASLGDAYRQLHNQQKANQAYAQAIQLLGEEIRKHPDQIDLKVDLAMNRAKSGDRENALQEIEQISPNSVKDPTILFEISITYELCGQRDKALNALTAAVRAGQSLDDVKNEPDLVNLRADPRYHLNVLSAAPAR